MQIDEYLLHYERFHIDCDIDASVEAKNAKLVEEMCEYLEAYASGDVAAADSEAIDMLNVSISLCVARGINNPLYRGFMKLEETKEKYLKNSLDKRDI